MFNPVPTNPLYTAYRLLASAWYRRAYAGDQSNRYFVARGDFYDRLAAAQQPEAADRHDYHQMYCMWRDHGYSDAVLHMILHFRGIDFDCAGEIGAAS